MTALAQSALTMWRPAGVARLCRTLDTQIVGFRRPDVQTISRVGTDQVGDLPPRFFHGCLGTPAVHVGTRRWIAEIPFQRQELLISCATRASTGGNGNRDKWCEVTAG